MSDKPLIYVQDADYSSAEQAVENIFQKFPLEVREKLVWVKPNMLGDFPPHKHITTHPAVIAAIVKKLISLDAKVVVGDNSGAQSIMPDLDIAAKSGLLEASRERFRAIDKEVVYKKLNADFEETVAISKITYDCDIMISVPKMKTHLQTLITGGIKNSYGMVVGIQKTQFHLKYAHAAKFAALVAEIFNLRRPDLIIMDAVYAMEGDGPNSPHLRPLNKIFASRDAVALDHYIARIMGMDIDKVPLLKYCREKGFGSFSFELEGGDEEVIANFKLPRTYFDLQTKNQLTHALLFSFFKSRRLYVNRKNCSLCGKCFKVCPAGAISWGKGPIIDPHKCLLCFCCKEMCEYEAIDFAKRYVYVQRMLDSITRFRERLIKK